MQRKRRQRQFRAYCEGTRLRWYREGSRYVKCTDSTSPDGENQRNCSVMTGEYISRAQVLLQYYAALNELANEAEPTMSGTETPTYFRELGFGNAEPQLSVA
jgi:hypothetical protein